MSIVTTFICDRCRAQVSRKNSAKAAGMSSISIYIDGSPIEDMNMRQHWCKGCIMEMGLKSPGKKCDQALGNIIREIAKAAIS